MCITGVSLQLTHSVMNYLKGILSNVFRPTDTRRKHAADEDLGLCRSCSQKQVAESSILCFKGSDLDLCSESQH